MAKYVDLPEFATGATGSTLTNRCFGGLMVVASTTNATSASEKKWVQHALSNTESEARKIVRAVIGMHDAQAEAFFTDDTMYTDAMIKIDIEALIPKLSEGF